MSTASTIASALRKRYGSGNATAIGFEVAAGTGAHARRHMDAVVMELWPSRGLTLHAIEIKVSKSDLKRELRDGQKAEEIAQYCDFMSIAAPLGMVKVSDLPSAWGLIEMDRAENLRTTREPKKTKSRAVDRSFMAAMIRAAGKPAQLDYDNAVSRRINEVHDKMNERINEAVKARTPDAELWRGLQAELKTCGVAWMWGPEVSNAVAFVLRSGVLNAHSGVEAIEKAVREAAERIQAAMKPVTDNVIPLRKK